ncbi:MAG: flagellar export chaperone FliS [Thermodesulfobacteriota bacterium]
MNNAGYRVYKQTNILTADEKRLIILCYEEAINSLRSAKTNYLKENYEAKGQAVQKALDIINELRVALNFEKGGIIAKNLDLIYGFLIRHILDADIKKDIKGLEQAASILSELKSAWEQVFYGNKSNQSLYASETQGSLIS